MGVSDPRDLPDFLFNLTCVLRFVSYCLFYAWYTSGQDC